MGFKTGLEGVKGGPERGLRKDLRGRRGPEVVKEGLEGSRDDLRRMRRSRGVEGMIWNEYAMITK